MTPRYLLSMYRKLPAKFIEPRSYSEILLKETYILLSDGYEDSNLIESLFKV